MAVALVVGASIGLAACGLTPAARGSLAARSNSSGSTTNTGSSASTDTSGGSTDASGSSDASGATTDTTGSGSSAASSSAPADGTGGAATGTGSTTSSATGTSTGTGATGTGTGAATTSGTGTAKTATGATKTTAGKSTTSTTKTGAATTTKTGAAQGSTTATASGPACSTAGGNATGITGSAINIGIHAPLTGTGTPFPNASFVGGSKLYWNDPAHTVCGRKISIDFQDDTYTPKGATAVCDQFAQNDFLAVGGAGTDQIQACATDQAIDSTGTPYLSAGVTENGLTSLPNYFAVSLTYRQQGAMIVKAAQAGGYATPAASPNGGQWAIVTANTDNFKDATTGIESALTAAGITYKEFRIDQSGNYQAAATAMGQSLALNGYKTVYTLTAPGYWVFQVGGYYTQSPTGNGVTWVGPGVSFTDFVVAQLACNTTKNAINGAALYLAANPGVDRASAAFKAAGGQDDIQWSLWGVSELLFQALQKASANGLTRQSFISTLSSATLPGGTDPAAVYNGTHFGGTGAWQQKIDCNTTEAGQNQVGTWDTVGNNFLTP